jgi:hypothetical protein
MVKLKILVEEKRIYNCGLMVDCDICGFRNSARCLLVPMGEIQ